METVKVSKKYQVVIPEKLRQEAKIKAGDKTLVLARHGILQYIPMRTLKKTKGMIQASTPKNSATRWSGFNLSIE